MDGLHSHRLALEYGPLSLQSHRFLEPEAGEPTPGACKLADGGFAAAVQAVLGLIAISVLIFKRYQEVPRRPVKIWALDASKQGIGALVAHMANIGIAILFGVLSSANGGTDDECAFYFVNFFLDTTFGVLLNWILLTALCRVALHFSWRRLQVPGDYGTPLSHLTWLAQLISWICVLLTTKILIGTVIFFCQVPIGEFASWLFEPLAPYPEIELIIVMIACPCCMNALQFWIQDSFLKKDVTRERLSEQSPKRKNERLRMLELSVQGDSRMQPPNSSPSMPSLRQLDAQSRMKVGVDSMEVETGLDETHVRDTSGIVDASNGSHRLCTSSIIARKDSEIDPASDEELEGHLEHQVQQQSERNEEASGTWMGWGGQAVKLEPGATEIPL